MKRWMITLLALVGLGVFIPSALALQTDRTPQRITITGVNPNDGRTVIVSANVTDATGQTIEGLDVDDFTLSGSWTQAGARIVSVESVTDDNLPLAVVLVIDTSSSMAGSPLAQTQAAARAFIEALAPDDTIAVVAFNDDPVLVQDYTTDRAVLLAALDNLPFGGRTSLYDAGALGVEVADRAPFPRRAVVLLSDGGEFGGASVQGRGAGRDAAALRGVPVYTIGLGFGTDRTYLQELSSASNGQFYESPQPADLAGIYAELAALFRSQYIITVESDAPLDGRLYSFLLGVAPEGILAASTYRAPIPVPIVEITPSLSAPLSGPTTFTARIRADSALESVTADTGAGPTALEDPYTLTIDPFTLPPGDYTLTVSATDAEGDTGTASLPFEVDAAQARLTLDVDPAALGVITAPTVITVSGETQSPVTEVLLQIDGETLDGSAALPAALTIDPVAFAPGVYTAEFVVTENAGTRSVLPLDIEIGALPPTVTIAGLEAGDTIDSARTLEVTIGGQTDEGTATLIVGGEEVEFVAGASPLTLPLDAPNVFDTPGEQTVTVAVTNAFGQTTEVEIPVVVSEFLFPTATPTNTPTPTPDASATALVLTQAAQATADQAAAFARATEDGFATATAQADLDAQATADAESTSTAQAEFAQIALETAEAAATIEMQSTIDAELAQLAAFTATADAQATLDAQATADVQLTEDGATLALEQTQTAEAAALATEAASTRAASTAERQAAIRAQQQTQTAITPSETPTPTEEPTATPTEEPTATATEEPTATDEPTTTPEPTQEPSPEPTPTTFDPTSTPVELTDIVAEAAQAPELPSVALIIGIIALIAIILLLIILRRRRNE